MNKSTFRAVRVTAAAALLTLAGAAAVADEAEIFQGVPNSVSSQRPNILFVFDTSGSMGTNVVTQTPYDPSVMFPGTCSNGRVYYATGNPAGPPNCATRNWISIPQFRCNAALAGLAAIGSYYASDAGHWRNNRWRSLSNELDGATEWLECRADAGVHGDGVDAARLWAADGNGVGPWTANSAQAINWNSNGIRDYTFYSANYVNWYHGPRTVTRTRLQIMQDTATQTINQLAAADNVNVGLMRFSNNFNNSAQCAPWNGCSAEGGMVMREILPVAANAADMRNDIAALNDAGNTPLSETMYEAYLYYSGLPVRFGLTSKTVAGAATPIVPSVSSSRRPTDQSRYLSPIEISCQRNYIVLLSDGEPTADNSADAQIQGLIGRGCTGAGAGRCLEEIAEYMYNNDLMGSLADLQNVVTYTIGFGDDLGVAGTAALRNTAALGGGEFYPAGDTASLSAVLTTIVRNILSFNTSFTAPAVSVNAFNRTQNLNDLYVSVFKPTETYAWPGNIKKYRFATDGTILDSAGLPAVDINTGFFRSTAQSYWSATVDGDVARQGGAASRLPAAIASRNVYTNLNSLVPITNALNHISVANLTITTATLGLGLLEAPGRDALINWLRGQDLDDVNNNGSTIDARQAMGDPMQGRPATVIYGGTVASRDPNDGVIFAVTNEGFLHAIDTMTGDELWAFMPQQLLSRTRDLYVNPGITNRVYGLDGNVKVNKIDLNDNGIVEPLLGDRVIIYAGMRRGGSSYFALDVTDRNSPQLLWRIGPTEAGARQLPGAGQSWSTPVLARVNISGAAQNAQQQVLVIGGGYDTVQDNGPYATDASGNRIYIVDAISGDRLWYAGPGTDASANLRLASMVNSIPSDIRVLDLTGDGFADRMYAADMGGRVWRFDINNGQPVASVVTGGVFASLGNAHLGVRPAATTRRFYSAPDVAYLNGGGRTWLNIALGSGYRGHPLDIQTQDRFYSLRDHRPLARLTQAQYNAATVITEADVNLLDVTSDIAPIIPAGASGWRIDLRRPSAAWTGEKSLSEARTVNNLIQFTTYEPNSASTVQSASCSPGVGVNRLYTISAFTAAPVLNRDNPLLPPASVDDRDSRLAQGGIAPEVVWVFPPPDDELTCVGAECRPPPRCLVGVESCGVGINPAPVRTFWRQTGIN